MKIILDRKNSNLVYFIKGWYDTKFWEGIGAIYKEYYAMDEINYRGVFHMIREIWAKILQSLPGDVGYLFLEEYDNLSLPSENWKAEGGIMFGIWYNPETDKFNNEDLIKARIVAMCSQIRYVLADKFEFMPMEKEFAGLKVKV